MKSVMLTGQRKLSLLEVPEPQVREADDVKIKICYVSICADETMAFSQYKRSQSLGHEFSGFVYEVGEKAAVDFAIGDWVTGYTWQFCGKCVYCRRGKENLCINLEVTGGLQEYVVLKDRQICKVPPGMSLQEACLFELTASCVHGLDYADIHMGDTVLILGGGGAGMVLLQLAKLAGATQITVSEPMQHKRELCRKLGATHVLSPYSDQLLIKGIEYTDGIGYDCIIDASRNEEAIHEALPLLCRGGVFLLFSLYNTKSRINLSLPMLYNGEMTLRTAYMAPYLMGRTMRVMSKLNLNALLSEPFPLDEAQQAYEAAYANMLPRVFVQVNPEP